MKVTSSYKIKIINQNKIFDDTIKKYREIVGWYIGILDKEWVNSGFDTIENDNKGYKKVALLSSLTHKTLQNPNPIYDFKAEFFGGKANQRVPSNYIEASMLAAIGSYSSYYSNLKNWEKEDEETRGEKPKLQLDRNLYPSLYPSMKNNYIRIDENTVMIKIYNKETNEWNFKEFKLKGQTVRNVYKKMEGYKELSPMLMKEGKRYFLSYPFEISVKQEKVKVNDRIIASVYLGIDQFAVVSIMDSNGKILARKFLDYKDLKLPFYQSINRVRKAQMNGSRKMPHKWRHVNDYNREIARRVAKDIVDFAKEYNFNVVVFEHIEKAGKKYSKNKQALSLWRGVEIQKLVEHKCHALGKQMSTIGGYNSMYLAFDGSGKGNRTNGDGIKNKQGKFLEFTTGKKYNIYLNASYNIGARYFLREKAREDKKKLEKKINKKLETNSDIDKQAEVIFGKTSDRTLNTLLQYNNFI